jgi:hypothetical protein
LLAASPAGAADDPYHVYLGNGQPLEFHVGLGIVYPGNDVTRGLVVHNESAAILHITELADVTTGLIIDPGTCLQPVPAGQTCTMTLTMRSIPEGTTEGGFSIISDSTDSPFPVTVKAWGGRATLEAIGHASMRFGNVAIDQTTEFQNLTVRAVANGDDLVATVSDISVVGEGADSFIVQGDDACPLIGPGDSCRLKIAARPTRGGRIEATLRVRSDATNDPFDVELSVTGREGILAADRLEVDLGTLPLHVEQGPFEVSWTNVGDIAITISGGPDIWFDNNDGVEFVVPTGSNGCRQATLAPEESCSMAYFVTVEESGPAVGIADMDSTASQADEVTIRVRGAETAMRVTKEEFDFRAVRVGFSKLSDDLYVSSLGSTDLTGVRASLTGSSEFSFDTNECTDVTVVRYTGCHMLIRYTPTDEGSDTAVLHVVSDTTPSIDVPLSGDGRIASISVADAGLSFKDVRVGEYKDLWFGISANIGPITVESVSFVVETGVFEIKEDDCSGAPFGVKGCGFRIRAAPYGADTWADSIRIVTDAGAVTVPLSVTGKPRVVRVEPDAVAFDVPLGGTLDEDFRVTNVSDGTVSVKRPVITQPSVGFGRFDIVASTCSGIDLAPGGTCVVGVTYTGFARAGEHLAELSLTIAGNGKVAAGLEGSVEGGYESEGVPGVGEIVEVVPTRVGSSTTASWNARVSWTRRAAPRKDVRGATWEVAIRQGTGPWKTVYRGKRQGAEIAARAGHAQARIRAIRGGRASTWRVIAMDRVVYDQGSVPSGWSRVRSSAALGRSIVRNKRPGVSVTRRASMRGIALVLRSGPASSFDVIVDGRLVGTVERPKSSTKDRVVAWRYAWSRYGTHRVRIRVRTGKLEVDGWLITR